MHLKAMRIREFRRLKDVLIDLDQEISVFVGANNSGKTSVAQALKLFTSSSRGQFSIHDFSASVWADIDAFGEGEDDAILPSISIDIWFDVVAQDLHRVIDLLPNLDWEGTLVGMRIQFVARDQDELRQRFQQAREQARDAAAAAGAEAEGFVPSPSTLHDYLSDNLSKEFELKYFVLDRTQFDGAFFEIGGEAPLEIRPDKGRSGSDVLKALIRVDFMDAQRHLSDVTGGSRSEELSRHLSRFYARNLEKHADDYEALHALSSSEESLNKHLATVFGPTLESLAQLGYPGLTNPQLVIKSALNPATIMSSQDGTQVHYAFGETDGPTLPDKHSGLGFKNLIYMVVELLDLHAKWMDTEEKRPPLHLIFVEEPEAHLHAQLQQVFVRQVLEILQLEEEDSTNYASQLVLTTHSPHILYERGFQPIRYFRREEKGITQSTRVLNVSDFYIATDSTTRDFLERYLKLTHCDLFFADAAILVEGNVERLLLPQMIESVSPTLKTAYLSILEIGGAFGHRFRTLIEFLGIVTLIVTDLDSVSGPDAEANGGEDAANGADVDAEPAAGKVCRVEQPGAVTSNQTLVKWLPEMSTIAELQAATSTQKIQNPSAESQAIVRVCYQTPISVTWSGETEDLTGRTLEEAFALENLDWCQDAERRDVKLRVANSDALDLQSLADRLHRRIKSDGFKKTDFALALLLQPENSWIVPAYIREGLDWLEDAVTPDSDNTGENTGEVAGAIEE